MVQVPDLSRDLFRSMLRIRRVEEALAQRYAQQQMRCPMHLCIGQEAIASGVAGALQPHDVMFSNHRAHGHYLAKGASLSGLVAELYGLAQGCSGGRGGSMHLIDLAVGFMGATPIVGGTVPLAVGAAWAARLRKSGQVAVVFFGDGCFEQGVVHESMNFAALHHLPVIFVCENNRFSVYTSLEHRQAPRPIYQIAASHGLSAAEGDGNDVNEVYRLALSAVQAAREGRGAQFLEFHTYRWREHCGPDFDDHLKYRSEEQVFEGQSCCPILRHQSRLVGTAVDAPAMIAQMELEIQLEIEQAFEFANSCEQPSPVTLPERMYA